ncbi:hypothetical protein AB4343_11555 [Vibrio breoganii]|nr:hypothetical protein [Vibrio breoganii]
MKTGMPAQWNASPVECQPSGVPALQDLRECQCSGLTLSKILDNY